MSAVQLYVSPYLPQFNVGNRGFVNAVFGGERYAHFARSKSLADFKHLVGIYQRISVFPSRRLQFGKGWCAVNAKQMRPRSATSVIADRIDRHPVSMANFVFVHPSDVVTSKCYDLTIRKAGVGVFRPGLTDVITAPFRFLIEHVFVMGSQKKVHRVHAGGVVASVKDVTPTRDMSVGFFIGKAMRQCVVAMPRKHAVSLIILVCRPFPAFLCGTSANLTPKSFIKHLARLVVFPVKVNG